MNKIVNKIFGVAVIAVFAMMVSCSGQNDNFDQYLENGERVYIGKLDSCKVFSGVQFLCCIEVVSLASVRCVCDVILGQFFYRPENSVCTACTECRMEGEVFHQMGSDILNAGTATEVDTHE
jgi:hypothetical protein